MKAAAWPERLPFVWHQDQNDKTWKYGDSKDGIGVFQDPDVEGKWYGNVVVPQASDITGIGPYDSIIEAMREAEIMYLRLKSLPI